MGIHVHQSESADAGGVDDVSVEGQGEHLSEGGGVLSLVVYGRDFGCFEVQGAFDGIEKRIAARLNTRTVGYNAVQNLHKINPDNLMQYITPQDLKSFGLIPEIIGRLPVLTYLNPLDREALKRILTEPKNAIVKQYVKLFAMDGVKLEFQEEVLDFIVDKAIEYKLGARGLRSITEAIMTDLMFEIPSANVKEYTVTLEYAKAKVDKMNLVES